MGTLYKRNLVFAAACIGMLLFGMVFLSLGTVSVFIQEKFRLDNLSVASLASSLPLGILAGSVVFGPIVDRYGYKALLISSAVLIGAAFEIIAYAPSVALLQISFFLIGLGGGTINGVTNALVADISDSGKASGLSLLGVFYGIGALGMPLMIGSLTHFFTYETVISGMGWILMLPLVFFTLLKFPEPKYKQGFPLSEALSLIKEPLLIIMGCILFFESALEGITGNWTTTYLKSGNMPVEKTLVALSFHVAAIAATRLLLSYVLKPKNSGTVLYISFGLIFTGAVLLNAVSSFILVLIAMICLGAGFAAVFPVILGMVGERYANMTGTAFSIVIVMALAGNSLINYLVGVISKVSGIHQFPFIIIFCVVCIVLLYRWLMKSMLKQTSFK